MRLFILLLTLSLSTCWMFAHYFWDVVDETDDGIENNVDTFGFAFNEIRIRVDTWIWMLGEHLVIVGLAVVIFLQEREYVKPMAVFVGLQVIDTIGWLLFYDDPLKDWPFSFNQLKIGIFLLAVLNEILPLWKKKENA